MPEWLTYVSAVMYDGKIVVKGLTMVLAPDGSPQWDETDYQIKVYYYDPDTPVSPKTADESNLPLWIILLAFPAGGIIGAAVIYKKRRSE